MMINFEDLSDEEKAAHYAKINREIDRQLRSVKDKSDLRPQGKRAGSRGPLPGQLTTDKGH